MIDSTINDDKTIADGGEGVSPARRYRSLYKLGQGGAGSITR